jgi:hypothetical protein
MRRDVFLKYGGFDERRYRSPAIEDIELGTWITADGRQIMLDRKVQCKHLKRWSLANMIKTDIFQRGIPWIDLMLRSGKVVKNLNVTGSQRLSVALVFTACLLVLLSVWWPWMLLGAAAAAALVTFINIKLYRYLKSRRGLWFAVWSLPLHWIYFGCCGISVIAGTAGFFISGRKAPNGCKYSSEPDGTTVTRSLRRGK